MTTVLHQSTLDRWLGIPGPRLQYINTTCAMDSKCAQLLLSNCLGDLLNRLRTVDRIDDQTVVKVLGYLQWSPRHEESALRKLRWATRDNKEETRDIQPIVDSKHSAAFKSLGLYIYSTRPYSWESFAAMRLLLLSYKEPRGIPHCQWVSDLHKSTTTPDCNTYVLCVDMRKYFGRFFHCDPTVGAPHVFWSPVRPASKQQDTNFLHAVEYLDFGLEMRHCQTLDFVSHSELDADSWFQSRILTTPVLSGCVSIPTPKRVLEGLFPRVLAAMILEYYEDPINDIMAGFYTDAKKPYDPVDRLCSNINWSRIATYEPRQ